MYKEVRADVYFLSPEEGGRDRSVDLRDPDGPLYRLLADFEFGHTESGHKIFCAAQVMLDEPGFIEPGVRQTVRMGLQCPERVIRPGARFELAEGPRRVVARGTIVSIEE